MPKRTYQPHTLKALKKLGFRARNSTKGGRDVLARRKAKGRVILSRSDEFRLKQKTPNARIK